MQKVNKLNIGPTLNQGKTEFEVMVKKGDEVLYHNIVQGGCLNFIESDVEIDKLDNTFNGQNQNFIFGHPAVILFAFDQLKQCVKKNLDENMFTLIDYIQKRGGKFNPNDK